jgi:hypothetical protein
MQYLTALFLLVVAGCGHPGHTVSSRPDPSDCSTERPPYCRPAPSEPTASQLQRTAYAEAVTHLGIPTRKETFADGSFVAEWTRQRNNYVYFPGLPTPGITLPSVAVPLNSGETIRPSGIIHSTGGNG